MGDLLENLITLVLWIVASFYLRSKRNKTQAPTRVPAPRKGPPPTGGSQPESEAVVVRRPAPDPLEEQVVRPRYPKSLDDLDEENLQRWERRLLEYADESGLVEDEDGWLAPWSGARYYDLDELFDLYVHRQGKPLQPPRELVLVEGPSGEQVPVLLPSDAEHQDPVPEPSAEREDAAPYDAPTVLEALARQVEQEKVSVSRPKSDPFKNRSAGKKTARFGSRDALVAGLLMSEAGILQRRSSRTRDF